MDAIVYTDGSGTTGGPAGIAYVAMIEGVLYEASLPVENATNQQAEILAAAYALDQIETCDNVIVYSDSEYVVKGMTAWLPGWIKKNWRTSAGRPVMNQPHWRRLIAARERHKAVTFRWCRGHDGVTLNERADVLAGEARQLATDQALAEGVA